MSFPDARAAAGADAPDDPLVRERTLAWIKTVVIGLNLCPFAAPVVRTDRLRIEVSHATTIEALATDLGEQLRALALADPALVDTVVLVHPRVLADFLDYNDFLDVADALIESLGLLGQIQVASFHPQYQFADATADDTANLGNRSPWPMLHLLREESIERAVQAFGDTDRIIEANVRQLRELGQGGVNEIWPPPAD